MNCRFGDPVPQITNSVPYPKKFILKLSLRRPKQVLKESDTIQNILKDFKKVSPTTSFIFILFLQMFIHKEDLTVLFTKVQFIHL